MPPTLFAAVLISGSCGLTWEVLWQHHAALALGVSAFGTAVTLAALMTGLGLGGLLAARLAQRGSIRNPLRAYAWAEIAIGAGGLLAPLGLAALGEVDVRVYAVSPASADVSRAIGTGVVLLLPATAMGATIPLLAPVAEQIGAGIARVYATNVAGAVCGVLLATFLGLPRLGVRGTALAAAALNVVVAVWAATRRRRADLPAHRAHEVAGWPPASALWLAGASGFAVFALEVAWFRSLRALLQSTTESFAIILATFLLSLALGGVLAAWLRKRAADSRHLLLPLAALAIVAATPLIDRLDRVAPLFMPGWVFSTVSFEAIAGRFVFVLAPVVVPITLLGTIFPWLLAEHATTSGTGRLTAVNTVGAVAGAVTAAFVFLPTIGAERTAMLTALVVLFAAIAALGSRLLVPTLVVVVLGGTIAVVSGPPVAHVRGQGMGLEKQQLLFVEEGPDTTVQVVRKGRVGKLIIDGFIASGEGAGSEYMEWMGHLPAMAAPALRDTLVICFGVGHTANAVRRHGPERLTVVDVSAAVLAAADYFPVNEGVLHDGRVHSVVMDGRAFLRRARDRRFDLVTLEPMAPNFAGTNNLYSREFYELVRSRLQPGGVAAQWLPIHLVSPEHMLAITAAFHAVFPFTRLWFAPGTTAILLGGTEPWKLSPSSVPLPLPHDVIERRFALDYPQVARMVDGVEPVTDDNQLLSYGYARFVGRNEGMDDWAPRRSAANQQLIRAARRANGHDGG